MTLEVNQLCKNFPTRSGALSVLQSISFTLRPGQAMAVVGPSGSGKSTLLHILGTLDRPTSGSITLDGQNPFMISEKALAVFRNRRVGFIFQDHHLLPQCSVLENVLIPTLVSGNAHSDAADRARALLECVGLSHRLEHRPAELSGGERQRAAVARALIQKPLLVLADEPTGNLDRKNSRDVGQLLLDLHQQEQTILIVVTHSAELARLFPECKEMVDGQLHALGDSP